MRSFKSKRRSIPSAMYCIDCEVSLSELEIIRNLIFKFHTFEKPIWDFAVFSKFLCLSSTSEPIHHKPELEKSYQRVRNWTFEVYLLNFSFRVSKFVIFSRVSWRTEKSICDLKKILFFDEFVFLPSKVNFQSL